MLCVDPVRVSWQFLQQNMVTSGCRTHISHMQLRPPAASKHKPVACTCSRCCSMHAAVLPPAAAAACDRALPPARTFTCPCGSMIIVFNGLLSLASASKLQWPSNICGSPSDKCTVRDRERFCTGLSYVPSIAHRVMHLSGDRSFIYVVTGNTKPRTGAACQLPGQFGM